MEPSRWPTVTRRCWVLFSGEVAAAVKVDSTQPWECTDTSTTALTSRLAKGLCNGYLL